MRHVSSETLDPRLVKWLQRVSKSYGFSELQHEMKKYPKENLSTTGEETQVQTQTFSTLIVVQHSQEEENVPQEGNASITPEAKVESWLKEVEAQVPIGSEKFSAHELVLFQAELTQEIESHFEDVENVDEEVQVLLFRSGQCIEESCLAKPSSKFPCNFGDIKHTAKLLSETILDVETQKIASERSDKMFHPQKTENGHGEVEMDLKRFQNHPRLFDLLCKYKDIFGPLPPPWAACPLVQMDLELKEEWVGKPPRQGCCPMPLPHQKK